MSADSQFLGALPARPLSIRATVFGRVTTWLILALLIGCWMAISDGLTREPLNDYDAQEAVANLGYEANVTAWLFAAVALPLLLIHGTKLKFSLLDSYLLWFVFCTTAYTKDFAYLKVPGIPIFITDISLAMFFVSAFVWPKLRLPRLNNITMKALTAFGVLGVIASARGVASGMDKTDVLRDLSFVVYALFFLVGLYSRKNKALSEQFCLMLICGAIVGTMAGTGWYLAHPEMRRYILYGVYVPMAFVLVALALVNRRLSPKIAVPLLLLLAWGNIIANARSTYLAIAVTFAALVSTGIGKRRLKDLIKPVLIGGLAIVLTVGLLTQTREGAKYMERISDQFVQGFVHTAQDDNAQFRFLAWIEAFRRFSQQPIAGEGFGVPFTFDIFTDQDVRPHNIYVLILYKLGIVGFTVFVLMLVPPTFAAWKTLRKYPDHPDIFLLRGLFLSQMFVFTYAAVNPFIESPFLACVFWLNLGFMWRLAKQIDADSSVLAVSGAVR